LLGRYVISSDNLLHEGAEDDVRKLVRRLTPSLGFYLVVLLLARVAPAAAAVGFLAVAVNGVVRA
jgi:hypothetical protein